MISFDLSINLLPQWKFQSKTFIVTFSLFDFKDSKKNRKRERKWKVIENFTFDWITIDAKQIAALCVTEFIICNVKKIESLSIPMKLINMQKKFFFFLFQWIRENNTSIWLKPPRTSTEFILAVYMDIPANHLKIHAKHTRRIITQSSNKSYFHAFHLFSIFH